MGWRDRPEKVVDTTKCGSWPFCSAAPLPGDRFCKQHREALDRVKAIGQRAHNSNAKAPAKVTVTKMKPISGEDYQRMILAALAAKPLTANHLAMACETNSHNHTFARARRTLKDTGQIVSLPQRGLEPVYALAPAVAVLPSSPTQT